MKSSKMQLRWVGGGLAAVLAAGLMGHAPQAQATVLVYDTFDNYGMTAQNNDSFTPTQYNSTVFEGLDTNNAPIRYVNNSNNLTTNTTVFSPVLPDSSLQTGITGGFGTNAQWVTRATTNVATNYTSNGYVTPVGNSARWFSLVTGNSATGAQPLWTLGYSVRTSGADTNYFNYNRSQSPFNVPTSSGYLPGNTNTPTGYGLVMADQTSNSGTGQVRRVQAQFNASTNTTNIGGTNYQITHASADMRLYTNSLTLDNSNGTVNVDNNSMSFGLRLFDAAQNQTRIGIGSGFYMLLSEVADSTGNTNESTNLAQIKVYTNNGGFPNVSGGVFNNNTSFFALRFSSDNTATGTMSVAYIDMTRWYHFDIDYFVSPTDNSDYATASVSYYNDALTAITTQNLFWAGTDGTATPSAKLPFNVSGASVTNTLNTVEFGYFNNNGAYAGIGSLDNLSITDGQPLPEPATLGLLALGTTLMLRRGKRA